EQPKMNKMRSVNVWLLLIEISPQPAMLELSFACMSFKVIRKSLRIEYVIVAECYDIGNR
ncbi:MAG: hypothetical protein ACFFDD_00550, partial [Promethearchaeota archaeon]